MESSDQRKHQTVHDFYEWSVLQVIAGFKHVTTSKWYLIFDIHYILALDLIHLITLFLAIRTLADTNLPRSDQVHIFENVMIVFFNVATHTLALFHSGTLNSALKTLHEGVYKYSQYISDEDYQIKKRRVGQIRLIRKTFTVILCLSVFSFSVCVPILQYLNGKKHLNPLLPLPIKFPFDTHTVFGFMIAYILDAIQIAFSHMRALCYTQLIVSCSLQLSAQIEILNFSLNNIEGRALKMMKVKYSVMDLNIDDLYEYKEFQDCLYECLRENIQHHHAILRLKQDIDYFMSNGVLFVTFDWGLVLGSKVIVIIQDPRSNIVLIFLLFCQTFALFQICMAGQMVTNKSEMTIQNLYSTPWYKCNKKFNVLLGMIITNSRIPMEFHSRGGLKGLSFSLEFFSDTLSFTYKIATILSSI